MKIKFKNESMIGNRIREQREKQKRSRNELAETLGISLSALQAWEINEREPQASMIITIANELGVSPNYLLTGEIEDNLLATQPIQHQRVATPQYQQYKEVNRKSDDTVVVNKSRLITAIETLEEILERRDRVMLPENKAQMIWIIYELLSEDESEDRENDKTFIIQLAEKLAA